MQRKYKAYINDINFSIELEGKELSTFVSHFGEFGDIQIYDQQKDECILNTKGVILDSFYPDMCNREMAQKRAGHLTYLFEDFRYQKNLKYPRGRLRSIYKDMSHQLSQMSMMENPVTVCNRCLHKVYPSCLEQYDYQCLVHDEDLFELETHKMDKGAYLDMMALKIGCPRDQIEELHCAYDAYIAKAYLHDAPVESPMTLEEFYEERKPIQEPTYSMALKF